MIIVSMSYTEVHFHLLPGVDDGPSSIEESLELARAAVAEGTGTIVATPHVHPHHVTDVGEVAERVEELTGHLRRERISVDVIPGGELAHSMVGRLSQAELESIAQGPPRRRWLLLEAPFAGIGESYSAAADELRDRGFAVVVAHPERAEASAATSRALERELAAGSALQLTAGSFAGHYGERVRTAALGLIRAASRTVIASDAHGGSRMPSLQLGVDALAAAGERDAARLAGAVPRALLQRGLGIPPAALVA
jgi:protein-tyrosine phosphatase